MLRGFVQVLSAAHQVINEPSLAADVPTGLEFLGFILSLRDCSAVNACMPLLPAHDACRVLAVFQGPKFDFSESFASAFGCRSVRQKKKSLLAISETRR